MYYIVYALLYVFSLLPLPILYLFSDAVYVLIFYVFGYRKNVVLNNLALAFPEKTPEERTIIAKKFYHNLTDTFAEMIKMVSAGSSFLEQRVSGNWEVINELYADGYSCQLHAPHTFNWEWGQRVITRNTPYKFIGVYMPISNKIFDRLLYNLRQRNGTVLIPANKMKEGMEPYLRSRYALGLAADQNPPDPCRAFWMNFFNHPAPFAIGPEKGARMNGIPVVFASFEKPKRGHYRIIFSLATKNPSALKEGELTLQFVHYTESVIRRRPDMWLWSHRRWKHAWKEEYRSLWIE
jgi:KDO2-lipid IV(A) lauroyltransferase